MKQKESLSLPVRLRRCYRLSDPPLELQPLDQPSCAVQMCVLVPVMVVVVVVMQLPVLDPSLLRVEVEEGLRRAALEQLLC